LVNIKGILNSLSNSAIKDISLKFPTESSLNFKIGQVISGEVLKVIDNSSAFVRLNEFEVLANTTKGLTNGEHLTVQVESLTPQIIMRLIGADLLLEDKLISLLKRLPVQQVNFGKSIENLIKSISNSKSESMLKFKEVLLNFPLKLSQDIKAEDIRKAIKDSGIFYEKKFLKLIETGSSKESIKELNHDIKNQLMSFIKEFELNNDNTKKNIDIITGAKRLINSIESHQSANILTQSDSKINLEQKGFIFQIPYLIQNEFKTIKFFLKNKKGGKGEEKLKEEYSLVFILDMINTGMLRINVSIKGKNVYCNINTEKEKVASFLRQSIPDLVKQLSLIGLNATVECSVARKEYISKEPIHDFLNVGNFQLLDITA